MATLRIPLVGSLTSRGGENTDTFGVSQKDQYFEDCILQVIRNSVSGRATAYVLPRSDFSVSASPSAGSGHGTAIRVWRGHSGAYAGTTKIISAFGSTNSTIYDGDTSLGAITGRCEFINETSISGVATLLFVSSDNRGYYYAEAGSLTEITDTDFPPKQGTPLTLTGNFALMDGYAFIMCTNGQIWHSDLNSVTGWTSTANITAQEYPDAGRGVVRLRNFIVAFSALSTEFFINQGNQAGAVLSRVQNLASKIGCVHPRTIVEFADTVYWVGQQSGSFGVYRFNGSTPEKVSTQEIDVWLSAFATTQARMHILSAWNRPFIAVTGFNSGELTTGTKELFVFDPASNTWTPWTLTDRILQSDTVDGSTSYYVGGSQERYLTSSTTPATATIQTAPIDAGTMNRKTLTRLRIVGDRATSGTISVSWSDDDYATFNTPRTIDLSKELPQLYRCGSFRRRAFKIAGLGSSATGVPQRLEAIELDFEVGAT